MNKKLLLTLGAGYICTQISNVKKIKINKDLNCYSKEEDLAIFILNNNTYEDLIVLNFNNENKRIKICNFQNEKEELSKFYSEKGDIETIIKVNLEKKLSIKDYIKFDYKIIGYYVDEINGINLKLTPREARLLNLELNENNTYKLNGEKLIEYLALDYKGVDKNKRLKKVSRILIDSIFEPSKKELINTISELITNIETSLSTKELVTLGLQFLKIGSNNIENYDFEIEELCV